MKLYIWHGNIAQLKEMKNIPQYHKCIKGTEWEFISQQGDKWKDSNMISIKITLSDWDQWGLYKTWCQ